MRLLVVEDEHRIANTIKKGLEQERFTVDVAYEGDVGLDMALTTPYDVIILDLMLPELDGLSICRELRKNHNHTPVLILTARGQIKDKVVGLDTGADDYLTKPFSFEELLARIRALSRRPPHALNDRLIISDLTLDTRTFEVYRGEAAITLSSKEFSLLEYLMRHAQKIVTKEQIISSVWEYDTDILPNTIEVYIRNLRNKIDRPFPEKKPVITTVRGFGYKLGE